MKIRPHKNTEGKSSVLMTNADIADIADNGFIDFLFFLFLYFLRFKKI